MGKILAALSVLTLYLAIAFGPAIVVGLVAWHFIAKYW